LSLSFEISGGLQVAQNEPDSDEADTFGRVLRFRRPGSQPRLTGSTVRPNNAAAAPDDDLARFEQERNELLDDRHRMLMNVLAAAIIVVLVGAGVWIADTIAAMEQDQDCILQGRANCAPIEVPAPRRP